MGTWYVLVGRAQEAYVVVPCVVFVCVRVCVCLCVCLSVYVCLSVILLIGTGISAAAEK